MANPYSQYTGARVQPVPAGYLQAYGNVGKMYSEGIAGLGEGIGEGIAKYYENKEAEEQSAALGDLFQVKEKAPAAEPGKPFIPPLPKADIPWVERKFTVSIKGEEPGAELDIINNRATKDIPVDKMEYFEPVPGEIGLDLEKMPHEQARHYVQDMGVIRDASGNFWQAKKDKKFSIRTDITEVPTDGPQLPPQDKAPQPPAAPADRFLPKKPVSVNERVSEWLAGQQLKGRKPNADTIARAEKAYQQESDNERRREMDAVAVKATELGMQKTQMEIQSLMGSQKPGEFKVIDLGVHPQTGKPIPYGMVSDPKGNFHFFKMPDEAADTPASQADADNSNAKLKEKKLPYQWVPNINEPGEFMLKSTVRPSDLMQLMQNMGDGGDSSPAPQPKKSDAPLTLDDLRNRK